MNGPTPRERARAETLAQIKHLALNQLAAAGAGELSLRAIARELNLVSSAIYRYYTSRDELITALLIDAYADLADQLEAVSAPGRRAARRRWADAADTLRTWARAEPHRFALIYGTPIPGYHAPADTVAPAGRVIRALAEPLTGGNPAAGGAQPRPGRALRGQLEVTAAALELDVAPSTMRLIVNAIAGLIGLVTLELGGHFVGGFEPADDLYAAYLDDVAGSLSL
ncbi:TetR/AcrR family transcriptional regulator [Microlunatus ginsengisoli]|uniref:TetR/AcrR family transcriptional regulator n=1 Tax=Microlunatus ginsengisoli TaxID=363863 RepID=A0ABP7AKF5_9ACTN